MVSNDTDQFFFTEQSTKKKRNSYEVPQFLYHAAFAELPVNDTTAESSETASEVTDLYRDKAIVFPEPPIQLSRKKFNKKQKTKNATRTVYKKSSRFFVGIFAICLVAPTNFTRHPISFDGFEPLMTYLASTAVIVLPYPNTFSLDRTLQNPASAPPTMPILPSFEPQKKVTRPAIQKALPFDSSQNTVTSAANPQPVTADTTVFQPKIRNYTGYSRIDPTRIQVFNFAHVDTNLPSYSNIEMQEFLYPQPLEASGLKNLVNPTIEVSNRPLSFTQTPVAQSRNIASKYSVWFRSAANEQVFDFVENIKKSKQISIFTTEYGIEIERNKVDVLDAILPYDQIVLDLVSGMAFKTEQDFWAWLIRTFTHSGAKFEILVLRDGELVYLSDSIETQ